MQLTNQPSTDNIFSSLLLVWGNFSQKRVGRGVGGGGSWAICQCPSSFVWLPWPTAVISGLVPKANARTHLRPGRYLHMSVWPSKPCAALRRLAQPTAALHLYLPLLSLGHLFAFCFHTQMPYQPVCFYRSSPPERVFSLEFTTPKWYPRERRTQKGRQSDRGAEQRDHLAQEPSQLVAFSCSYLALPTKKLPHLKNKVVFQDRSVRFQWTGVQAFFL